MNELERLIEAAGQSDEQARLLLENIAGEVLEQRKQELDREQQALDEQLAAILPDVLLVLAREIERSKPVWLPLPASLAVFEREGLYQAARLVGRVWFRSEQYTLDPETFDVVRDPRPFPRDYVLAIIHTTTSIPDAQMSAAMPLAFRVGYVVGWLSGLSVSQKDDAQAGMVMLTALVSPLLLGSPASSSSSAPAAAGALSSPRRRSSKSARPGRRASR